MLNLELDRHLEAGLLEIAHKEHRTPAQIINHLLAQYLEGRQSPDLLVNVAKRRPPVEAFLVKDPLAIQQEMRDEWR